ncbi:MAG: T9SS type A sorting domain-containing protein [Calditrichota bacterium]
MNSLRTVYFAVLMCMIGGSIAAYAQDYLNNPESMVFDEDHDCWYVSNYGDGKIIQMDAEGHQTIFSDTLGAVAGLLLRDGILYCASNDTPFVGVIGFDVLTRTMVVNVPAPIAATGMVNDLIADNAGFLYFSDFYDNKIYKVNPDLGTAWLFAASNLQMPNGLEFDPLNNRLLVSCQNAAGRPLKAVSLADTSVSIVVYMNLWGVDGLAFDSDYNLYISSWQTNSVHRYDATLSGTPEVIASGYDGPADIAINHRDHILGVPSFNNNAVFFVDIAPDAVTESAVPRRAALSKCYPNPFNAQTVIEYSLPAPGDVTIAVYDALGRLQETLLSAPSSAGDHRIIWNAANYGAGLYFYRISTAQAQETRKLVLIK